MALIGTFSFLVVGYPLAYFLATRAGRYKTMLFVLIIVPFWTSFLIRTYAWETILDSQGALIDSKPADMLSLGYGPALGWASRSEEGD